MLSEELFNQMKEKLEGFAYTSLTYTDYSEIADFNVLKNNDDLILLSGYNSKLSWIEYHFAANTVDKLLSSMDMDNKLHISFVPREWVEEFKQRGFEIYATYNDYNNPDIHTVEPCEEPELLTEAECEAAAAVTQACRNQSRGFHGETADWVRSWIIGEEASATDTDVENCVAMVHREDNEIVGVLFTCTYAHTSPKGPIAWVREVAVHPDYQRRGIARKLILQALNYGKAHGATRAFLIADECNVHAIRLYESLGFVGNKEEGQIDMILIR